MLFLITLVTLACAIGYVAGRVLQPGGSGLTGAPNLQDLPKIVGITADETEYAPQGVDELFVPFWQAWKIVHEQYVDQPVDDIALMRGAISGMLEALGDQHTSYLNPEEYTRSNSMLQGDGYEGIGAWVDTTGEYLRITSPMPGSPAEKAGLKPGDIILEVDGEDMTGIDGELVRQRMLGPAGTVVTLTIRREGVTEPIVAEVVRADIIVPSVSGEMLESNIAYVQLRTFGAGTTRDLRRTLESLLAQDPKGLILDVRSNGGGYLDTAIEVTSEFIGDGVVMVEERGDGTETIYESRPGGLATDISLVVLVNEGSASASEILAGAIQDRDRGTLIGMTTFGKGSVQGYTLLENEQGAIRVTVARWLTPLRRQIHEVGLEPDVQVEISDADLQAGNDPQLEAAVNLLNR
jgi:carboxyl-terminal processing protease